MRHRYNLTFRFLAVNVTLRLMVDLPPKQEELGRVEEQFQFDLHIGHQQTSGPESVQMLTHVHDYTLIAIKRLVGFFQRGVLIVLPAVQGDDVVVIARLGQHQCHIEIIHPALRSQQRLSFIAMEFNNVSKKAEYA